MKQLIKVKEVRAGWNAPGYRDPELHFITDNGELYLKLSPQAFVELHNALCEQQACIDRTGRRPLDAYDYPYDTRHVAQIRGGVVVATALCRRAPRQSEAATIKP